jgi:hypothetical protein
VKEENIMQKHWYAFLLLVLGILSGCASLEKQAGFDVEPKAPIGRQEPWHNLTLVGDVSKTMAVSVAYIGFPESMRQAWKEEFVDAHRVYTIDIPDGKKARKPLEKVVFRALLYRDERFVEMFDAVLNPQVTGFFVLLPPSGEQYVGKNLVIVSSDASWLMTAGGEKIDIVPDQSLQELPRGFFSGHPSALTQVIRMDRGDPAGGRWFAELESLFPKRLQVHGVEYSGRPDTKIVAALFTKVDNPIDRFVSCGSLTVAPGMVTIGLAVSAVRNLYVMGKSDCYK